MKTLKVLFILLLGAIGLLINSAGFAALWNWFVAPLFGLESMKLGYAMGVMTLLSFLTMKMGEEHEIDELLEVASKTVTFLTLKFLVLVTIGAIIHQFV